MLAHADAVERGRSGRRSVTCRAGGRGCTAPLGKRWWRGVLRWCAEWRPWRVVARGCCGVCAARAEGVERGLRAGARGRAGGGRRVSVGLSGGVADALEMVCEASSEVVAVALEVVGELLRTVVAESARWSVRPPRRVATELVKRCSESSRRGRGESAKASREGLQASAGGRPGGCRWPWVETPRTVVTADAERPPEGSTEAFPRGRRGPCRRCAEAPLEGRRGARRAPSRACGRTMGGRARAFERPLLAASGERLRACRGGRLSSRRRASGSRSQKRLVEVPSNVASEGCQRARLGSSAELASDPLDGVRKVALRRSVTVV